MTRRIAILIMLITLVAVISISCSDNDDNMVSPNDQIVDAIVEVSPTDGSTAVSRATSIAVTFSRVMDTMLVMNNTFISYGDGMHDWLDSAAHYGGMGMMSQSNMDRMMNRMEGIKVPGEFHWNDAKDSCEFIFDSNLMPDEDHMILLCEEDMMMSGGMMGGNQNATEFSEHHFRTGQ